MSYTKGPWKWKDGDADYDKEPVLVSETGEEVIDLGCSTRYDQRAGWVNDDDKPLLAAAPELLEALKAFKRDWHELSGSMRGTTLDAVDKAIAKAEGRTE